MTDRNLRAMLRPLQQKIASMVSRSVVRLINDTQKRQLLQVEILKGELRDGVEHPQNYGFAHHPFPNSDAFLVSIAGTREQGVALIVDDRRYRMMLEEGEVCVYDDLGNFVKLMREKVMVNAVQQCHIVTPLFTVDADESVFNGNATFNGNVDIQGNYNSDGTMTNNGKNVGSTHTHPHGDPAGVTGPVS